ALWLWRGHPDNITALWPTTHMKMQAEAGPVAYLLYHMERNPWEVQLNITWLSFDIANSLTFDVIINGATFKVHIERVKGRWKVFSVHGPGGFNPLLGHVW